MRPPDRCQKRPSSNECSGRRHSGTRSEPPLRRVFDRMGRPATVTFALLPALLAHSAPLTTVEPGWATVAGVVARGTVLAMLGAAMGFALAAIGRNTAVALGVGFAYVVVLENILGSSIAGWRRWL